MSIRHEFFEQIPECLKCPVTGLYPTNEEQLSGLIGLYWKRKLIDWSKVNLYTTENKKSGNASKLFDKNGVINCEYPLFAEKDNQIKNHGGMKADIIFIANQNVVLIESKIGSKFTYDGTQLKRQAKYLNGSKIKNKFLILLSSTKFFDKGWYTTELDDAVKKYYITGYLMHFEDIFVGITNHSIVQLPKRR